MTETTNTNTNTLSEILSFRGITENYIELIHDMFLPERKYSGHILRYFKIKKEFENMLSKMINPDKYIIEVVEDMCNAKPVAPNRDRYLKTFKEFNYTIVHWKDMPLLFEEIVVLKLLIHNNDYIKEDEMDSFINKIENKNISNWLTRCIESKTIDSDIGDDDSGLQIFVKVLAKRYPDFCKKKI